MDFYKKLYSQKIVSLNLNDAVELYKYFTYLTEMEVASNQAFGAKFHGLSGFQAVR